jgi:bifunctional UDP-N-acetylglucosamine pyrophosphorylase/glucosamine-1-phosphate N-acetyltransferase
MSPTDRPLSAIILAAGEGSRMKSERPKPLHLLCGRPMLMYVLDSLRVVDPDRAVIVVGHKAERVTRKISGAETALELEFVEQHVQRGTGDAVLVGLVGLPEDGEEDGDVLVVPGDAPLLRPETIAALVDRHRSHDVAATVLTAHPADATGYGRVVRGKENRIERIVEQRDAASDELSIDEINTSIYCFRRSVLAPALRRLEPDNSQGEYYLTDVIGVLSSAGYAVDSLVADRIQLAEAEAVLRRRTNELLARNGVTMLDPSNTFVDTTVVVGRDVTLFPGTILQGDTVIGDGSEIGPNTRLVDCAVGSSCVVENSTGRQATVGDRAVIGPYAVLVPGTKLADGIVTGPFYNSGSEG